MYVGVCVCICDPRNLRFSCRKAPTYLFVSISHTRCQRYEVGRQMRNESYTCKGKKKLSEYA